MIDGLDRCQPLVLLARGDDRVGDRKGKLAFQRFQIQRRDRRIRDDMRAAGGKNIEHGRRRAAEQAGFNMDIGHAVRARQA